MALRRVTVKGLPKATWILADEEGRNRPRSLLGESIAADRLRILSARLHEDLLRPW